eukprot:2197753-Amphidinium_carterae.1
MKKACASLHSQEMLCLWVPLVKKGILKCVGPVLVSLQVYLAAVLLHYWSCGGCRTPCRFLATAVTGFHKPREVAKVEIVPMSSRTAEDGK